MDKGEKEERIVIPIKMSDEIRIEDSIRPSRLDEFIGQKPLKDSLRIIIDAAKIRREPAPHTLFSGPPGLGKTTLAKIMANEMDADIKIASGPTLKPTDAIKILASLDTGDVFFIDEIHRLNTITEEILYPAMEDFEIHIVEKDEDTSRPMKLPLNKFTLIGATTKLGLLTGPLRDRFGFTGRLNLYGTNDLIRVINRSSSILGHPISHHGAVEIAKRSRGTPRIANRLLQRARDYAQVRGSKEINVKIVNQILTILGIDKLGLDDLDRRILTIIHDDFNGGPVGVKTISISIGEEVRTIEDVYEPYLIHIGFLKRTSQGREITDKAKEHLNFDNKISIASKDNKIMQKDDDKITHIIKKKEFEEFEAYIKDAIMASKDASKDGNEIIPSMAVTDALQYFKEKGLQIEDIQKFLYGLILYFKSKKVKVEIKNDFIYFKNKGGNAK